MSDFRVDDFSGGQTDLYLNCDSRFGKKVLNFDIDQEKKLVQRPGSSRAAVDQIPSGASPLTGVLIDRCYPGSFNGDYVSANIVVKASTNMYQWNYSTTDWDTIATGVANNGHASFIPIGDRRYVMVQQGGNAYMCYYSADTNAYTIRRLGVPLVDPYSNYVITPQANDGKTYIYYFVYHYEYYVMNGRSYIVEGDFLYRSATASASLAGVGHYNVISSLPKCDGTGHLKVSGGYILDPNGAALPYTVRLAIYRTTNGGTIPYLVGYALSNATTFTDDVTDAALVSHAVLYSAGGEVNREQPGTMHSAAVTDKGQIFYAINFGVNADSASVVQTLPGNPEALSMDFCVNYATPVIALNTTGDYLVAFESFATHRVEGSIDSTGMGSLVDTTISSTIGCYFTGSSVRVGKKVYFLSRYGVCMTDGFNVVNLTPHLRTTFANLDLGNLSGVAPMAQGGYQVATNTIRWLVINYSSTECRILTLHLDHTTEQPGGGAVTFWDMGAQNFPLSVSSEMDYYGTAYGYLHYISSALLTDELRQSSSVYFTKAINTEYESGVWSFGTELFKKWLTRMEVVFDNLTDLFVQFYHVNDKESTFTELAPMRFEDHSTQTSVLRRIVRFTSTMLRATYKQIKIVKGFLDIYTSDTYSLATISGSNPTTICINTKSPVLPADLVGREIFFEYTKVSGVDTLDSYATSFPILTRSDDTLTVTSAAGLYPKDTTTGKWKIKGQVKTHKMRIFGLTIPIQTIGDSQQKGAVGEGAST